MAFTRTSFVYDVFIYQCYARGFWQGADQAIRSSPATAACKPFWDRKAGRFHALPREYPALSLAVFSLPLLTPWLPYNAAFLLWMAFLLLVSSCLLAWRGPPWSAIALPLYVLLAGWQFVLARYDLVPGLCILLAVMAAYRGKHRTAAAIIAVGTLLKIFPVLLLPVLLLAWRREKGRWRIDCLFIFAGVLAGGIAPALLLNAPGTWAPIAYALQRPPQVGATPGILLWLTSVPAHAARIVFSYGSYNVTGARQSIYTATFLLPFLAGLAAAYWRQWRGHDTIARGFVLVLIITLVTNKVFSPQYIMWVLPTVAVYEGVRLRWLIAAALVALVYSGGAVPIPFIHLPAQAAGHLGPQSVLAIIACNGFLVVLGAWYALREGDAVRYASSRKRS